VTRAEIDEACRELVRRKVLIGWYSFMWTDGRKWTLNPNSDDGTVTHDRLNMVAYLSTWKA